MGPTSYVFRVFDFSHEELKRAVVLYLYVLFSP